MTVTPDLVGLSTIGALRDVWSGAPVDARVTRFTVPAHGVVLLESVPRGRTGTVKPN